MEYEEKNNWLVSIGGILLWLYGISTQIMAVYFWWKMMKEDNFFMGIVVDPIIAEFKGILWPFFI